MTRKSLKLQNFSFKGKLKPALPIGADLEGWILFGLPPLGILASVGSFLAPLFEAPENNVLRIFIVDVLDYDFEKSAYRYLFRVVSSIIAFLSTSITLSVVIGYAGCAILYTHMLVTWPPVFVKTTSSRKKIMTAYPTFCALRVYHAIGQDVARIITPVFIGFSFVVTVITNVIVLAMSDGMNPALYILCAIVAISFIVFTIGLLQFASQASKSSNRYIEHFRKLAALMAYPLIKKIADTLRGCELAVASFYNVGKETVLAYGDSVVSKTIDSLIIFA